MNILNNKYAQLGIVGLLVVLLILALQWQGGSPVTTDSSTVLPKNYEELKNEISTLPERKWSKSQLGSLESMVDDFQSNKLISEDKAKELRTLLLSNYLLVLTDTIKGFCRQGTNMGVFQQIASEINTLHQKEPAATSAAKTWADHYAKITGVIATTRAYTYNQPYNQALTSQYEQILKSYQTTQYIEDNQAIQQQIDELIKKTVVKHKILGDKFNRFKDKPDFLDCSEFAESSYYTAACQRAKKKAEEEEELEEIREEPPVEGDSTAF